ncbi:ewing's tumor-associated antigen 1 isoform X2 [Scleropages formosus]|uniref:ewing's tumor-associated antigen 1 isoform X2 n=1 Tax=Scleropages formosus TaxID=113540 RepID=UPI00087827DD|nr:ewing's tumor-associated antigen 1 isoform X2 [Scleropages formosus]
MSAQGQRCASPPGPTRRPRKQQVSENKGKCQKLSRSSRQTQQSPSLESSYHCEDFKTPKRHAGIKLNGLNNADSPNNDSELLQDIIWDPTSPTPLKNGKDPTKLSKNARIVDISEIVNRIAPKYLSEIIFSKNERPCVPESNLLQWIGDSAIPCTPEVRHRRTRKPTRQNCVEDLKKLAMQFDINMIQQDKEQVKHATMQGTEGAGDLNNCGVILPVSLTDLEGTSKEANINIQNTNTNKMLHQKSTVFEMDDNLDALFDGPTQPISGRLSPSTPVQSQDTKIATVTLSSDVSAGETAKSIPSNTSTALSGNVNKHDDLSKTLAANPDFEDDWDDDLLDDSFVLELTLNPDLIAAPMHCSTQISANANKDVVAKATHPSTTSTVTGHGQRRPDGHLVDGSVVVCKGKNEKSKHRSTFRLEANPHFQAKGTLSEHLPRHSCSRVLEEHAQSHCSSAGGVSCVAPEHQCDKVKQHTCNVLQEHTTQKLFGKESSSAVSNSCSMSLALNHGCKDSKGNHDEKKKEENEGIKVYKEVSDEDLDSFFAADSLWDNGDDDDLLCQLCEDVERFSECQAQASATTVSPCEEQNKLKTVPPSVPHPSDYDTGRSNQKQLTNVTQLKPNLSSEPGSGRNFSTVNVPLSCSIQTLGKMTTSIPNQKSATSNLHCMPAIISHETSVSVRGPYKYTQVRSTSVTGTSACRSAARHDSEKKTSSLVSSGNALENRHTSFKRHLSDPVAPTNKVFVPCQTTAKCTEAEIERKKQQAMARRRLRMQAAQKLGAPT